MIMDNGHTYPGQSNSPIHESRHEKDLEISNNPPTPPNEDSNQESIIDISQLSPQPKTTSLLATKGTLKRSFDVAFLMMPDERLKKSQPEKIRALPQIFSQVSSRQQEMRRYPQITARTPRVYDDPTVVISSPEWECPSPLRSAFTKVTSRLESPNQPAPPLSPDQLSCSSMSPPVATTPPRSASGSGSSDIVSIDGIPASPPALSPNTSYHNFRPELSPHGAFQSVQALQTQRFKQQLLYRAPNISSEHHGHGPPSSPPDFLPMYPGFPFPHAGASMPHPFGAVSEPELPRIVQNPAAAAILSTLIPPTLASTFTLTAQNVCAKCNISFRMTSDLVYHMRSHHKSEVAADPNRRKREEKLKCPVCNETFRERHHLTRHMTAHQDKESDQATSTTTSAHTNSYVSSPSSSNTGRSSAHRSSAYSK